MTLMVGQAAPDGAVYNAEEVKTSLSSYWNTGPLVLTFLRHFGCVFCREFISKLRTAYPEFVERGASVVAVAQGSPAQAAHFGHVFRVPFPILSDPGRQVYQAFGLGEGTLRQTVNPAVIAHMAEGTARGHLPGIGDHLRAVTGSDGTSIKQIGGTFVIDQQGLLQYIHVATPIYKNPTIEELLTILAA